MTPKDDNNASDSLRLNDKPKEQTMDLIGKVVIVRANVAGVHAGIITAIDLANKTVQLKEARRLWRVYTRDKSGSISDIAANGLKEGAEHQIGVTIPTVTIINNDGLELAEMTEQAWASVRDYEN